VVSLLPFVLAGLWLEGMPYPCILCPLSVKYILAARSLYQLDSEYQFAVVVTSLNVIQWGIVIAIPIVQVSGVIYHMT